MATEDDIRNMDSIENVIGLSPRDPLNGFAGKAIDVIDFWSNDISKMFTVNNLYYWPSSYVIFQILTSKSTCCTMIKE